jgi:hypothetical protein
MTVKYLRRYIWMIAEFFYYWNNKIIFINKGSNTFCEKWNNPARDLFVARAHRKTNSGCPCRGASGKSQTDPEPFLVIGRI